MTRALKKKRENAFVFSSCASTCMSIASLQPRAMIAHIYGRRLQKNNMHELCMTEPSELRPWTCISVCIYLANGCKHTSMSAILRSRLIGGLSFMACSILASSLVFARLSRTNCKCLEDAESRGPRCFEGARFFFKASGGCMGS